MSKPARGIVQVRTGFEIQNEINKLTKLQAQFETTVDSDKRSAMATEISTIITILSWVGSCAGFPSPSAHIEKFLLEHPEYRASVIHTI